MKFLQWLREAFASPELLYQEHLNLKQAELIDELAGFIREIAKQPADQLSSMAQCAIVERAIELSQKIEALKGLPAAASPDKEL
jgi:hypothetical protein